MKLAFALLCIDVTAFVYLLILLLILVESFSADQLSLLVHVVVDVFVHLFPVVYTVSEIQLLLSFAPGLGVEVNVFSVNAFIFVAIEFIDFFIIPFCVLNEILSFFLTLGKSRVIIDVFLGFFGFCLGFVENVRISS